VTVLDLQTILNNLGYSLVLDGDYGPKTRSALLTCLTDGTDDALRSVDIAEAASKLKVDSAKIWAVWDVEAASRPFIDGRPAILFEPHIFSRLTKHRFDRAYPSISSRSWNRKLYPGSQEGRWNQLLLATGLDVDAGLSSASYGGFQILGANYRVCGFSNPWDFVYAQSRSEGEQLRAFVNFVIANKLDRHLQAGNWAAFAKGYNGPAYKENKYDEKLAKAYRNRLR